MLMRSCLGRSVYVFSAAMARRRRFRLSLSERRRRVVSRSLAISEDESKKWVLSSSMSWLGEFGLKSSLGLVLFEGEGEG